LESFFQAHGITPELKYGDIQDVTLLSIAADLNKGNITVYGLDKEQSILEGVLASTALPPWIEPIERADAWLMDGGAVSPLPIEPAIKAGATQIFALGLIDSRDVSGNAHNFGVFLNRLLYTSENRHLEMELELAKARNISVFYIDLIADEPVPLWDFSQTDKLIEKGYEITVREIEKWRAEELPAWLNFLPAGVRNRLRKSTINK
jgi:NTE family protein